MPSYNSMFAAALVTRSAEYTGRQASRTWPAALIRRETEKLGAPRATVHVANTTDYAK